MKLTWLILNTYPGSRNTQIVYKNAFKTNNLVYSTKFLVMKIRRFIFLLLPLHSVAQQATPFKIEGRLVEGQKAKYAYLCISPNGVQRTQLLKAPIVNNSFVFTGVAKHPPDEYADASIAFSDVATHTAGKLIDLWKERNYDRRMFVLTNAVTIEAGPSIREAKVTGGHLNDISNLYNDAENKCRNTLSEQEEDIKALRKQYAGDKGMLEKLEAEYMAQIFLAYEQRALDWIALIKQYPLERKSMFMLSMLCKYNKSVHAKYQQLLEETWAAMPAEVKASKITKNIPADLVTAKTLLRLKEGDFVPDFTFTNDDNTKVALTSFRGKYLLVDFWTSWCGPCRNEHYFMKKAYDQYKDKGFTVLQISLDEKKEKWLKALQQDQLPWQNLRSIHGWDKQLQEVFNFNGVPSSFLVSPEGKIIARNLRGESLEKKLAELIP
jgi:peroxiredoxin